VGDGAVRSGAGRGSRGIQEASELAHPVTFEQSQVGRRHGDLQGVGADLEAGGDRGPNSEPDGGQRQPAGLLQMLLQTNVNRLGRLTDIARVPVPGSVEAVSRAHRADKLSSSSQDTAAAEILNRRLRPPAGQTFLRPRYDRG